MCPLPFYPWPVLGDKGIGGGTDGWAGHQSQGHVAQGLREVDAGDGLEAGAQRLHVGLLGVGIPGARVQDVAAVQDEEEGVDRARLSPEVPSSIGALLGVTGVGESEP